MFRIITTTAMIVLFLFALMTSLCFAGGGDTQQEYEIEGEINATIEVHFFGLTLGEDWSGFPAVLAPDYNSNHAYSELDVNLEIYIDWELHFEVGDCYGDVCGDPDAEPEEVTPRRLADEGWFDTSKVFATYDVADYVSDTTYNACPDNVSFETPSSFPASLSSDGELELFDVFGGIGDEHIVWVQRTDTDAAGRLTEIWVGAFQWNRPATYNDIDTDTDVDAYPGDFVTRPYTIALSLYTQCGFKQCVRDMYLTQVAVEWPSCDQPGTTPRYTDSSDTAAFAGAYGSGGAVVWGFDSDGGPSYATIQADVAPFGGSAGYLDGSDLAAFAQDLTYSNCSLSKAEGQAQADAILEWFAITKTGNSVVVVPGGEAIPEYEFSDPEQTAIAIANPDGYLPLMQSAIQNLHWGSVKTLYR